MSIVVAIQARLGSSRLPGKVLMPLAGVPMLRRVWDACRGPWRRVVLTSSARADNPLARWLEAQRMEYRRGSLEDVLSRYASLAAELKPDRLVRVCGDAPFIRAEWIAAAAVHKAGKAFVPRALHCGTQRDWEEADKSTEPSDWTHAGYYWFERAAPHLNLVPSSYMMVNTPEDFAEAERRLAES